MKRSVGAGRSNACALPIAEAAIAAGAHFCDLGGNTEIVENQKALNAAGATADKRVISYCHIGQQATVVYFAARLLGRDARLYDGSWDQWSRMPELPIETGRR